MSVVYPNWKKYKFIKYSYEFIKKHLIDDLFELSDREKEYLSHPQPYGPSGWLAAFIGECFFYPLNTLITFAMVWGESVPQNMLANMMVYLTATLILSYLSVKAGWALRKIKPEAVRSAKIFLLITVLWALTTVVISQEFGYANRGIAYYYQRNAVIVILNYVLWRSYFEISKRVKNTYPD